LVSSAKAGPPDKRPHASLIKKAEPLCLVPDGITRSMTDYTKDPGQLFERRRLVAEMIEQLAE
jgi:hypothetical protein